VPHFPGLSIELILAEFRERVAVYEYLPDGKPILRVPRSFVLDVRLVMRTGGQIVRTLAPG
jgi:hypothetical protein